jgi:hypothetical protein
MFHPLKNLIASRSNNHQMRNTIIACAVIEISEKTIERVYGAKIAQYVQTQSYRNKMLKLFCRSSAIVQEISLKRAEFLLSLNEKLFMEFHDSEIVVTNIKFSF